MCFLAGFKSVFYLAEEIFKKWKTFGAKHKIKWYKNQKRCGTIFQVLPFGNKKPTVWVMDQ